MPITELIIGVCILIAFWRDVFPNEDKVIGHHNGYDFYDSGRIKMNVEKFFEQDWVKKQMKQASKTKMKDLK
tara:strand:+ start:156 stop:371 length:216 start_codon:yes stop_codon:yes gene_type:complete